ncbi:MAG: DUF1801 domain-containing protein [Eggerthellaceae bacterium]|nr:DUF1801 domain-containing protein [Eggerthellaceae bacterium]
MWKCPSCGREFKNANQSHYCDEKPASIDAYIAAQVEDVQQILIRVRETIRAAAPDAVQKMSWNMPTFWQNENLIHFAAQKNHLGIHPGAIERLPVDLVARINAFKASKGTIQMPYDKVDYELIADIVKWRVSCGEGKSSSRGDD